MSTITTIYILEESIGKHLEWVLKTLKVHLNFRDNFYFISPASYVPHRAPFTDTIFRQIYSGETVPLGLPDNVGYLLPTEVKILEVQHS